MLKIKLFTILLAAKALVCGCDRQADPRFEEVYGKYRLIRCGTFPAEIDESSGFARSGVDSLYFTHNDGNAKALYLVSKTGRIEKKITLNAHFGDLEDLAQNDSNQLYLCDVGNNLNTRPNLFIYTFDHTQNRFLDTVVFYYPDQKAFPPTLKDMNFDCEAVIYFNDSLYLFSKNRGIKKVQLYQLPSGTHGVRVPALLYDATTIKAEITAADINPSKTKFALLTYGYVYLFAIRNNRISFQYPLECRKIGRGGQLEAICFINDNDLLISNEGGKIWTMQLR